MSSTSTTERTATTQQTGRRGAPIFAILTGISALAVLLQGLWAGIFLRNPAHLDAASGWIDVHARGGDVALLFAALATAYAFFKLRARRDLWIGAGLLTVLLALEAWIGGMIRDDGAAGLTAVHIPLAMGIMGLAVWLPLRSRRHRAG